MHGITQVNYSMYALLAGYRLRYVFAKQNVNQKYTPRYFVVVSSFAWVIICSVNVLLLYFSGVWVTYDPICLGYALLGDFSCDMTIANVFIGYVTAIEFGCEIFAAISYVVMVTYLQCRKTSNDNCKMQGTLIMICAGGLLGQLFYAYAWRRMKIGLMLAYSVNALVGPMCLLPLSRFREYVFSRNEPVAVLEMGQNSECLT